MKADLMAIGVHPDDVELGCSGTVIKAVRSGKKVVMVDLTRGELGTRGTPEIREREAAEAARIMGVNERVNLGLPDGFFERNRDSLLKLIVQIRRFRPDIVLGNSLHDRHPDHGRAGELISEACFLSGLRKIETEFEGATQAAWRPRAVYHYLQDYWLDPGLVVDVSEVWEDRMKAVYAYASQFYNPDSDEPETPISSKDFMAHIEGRAKQLGRLIGVDYAEGFVMKRPPGVKDIFDVL